MGKEHLTEKRKQQLIIWYEENCRSKHDDLIMVRDDDMLCFDDPESPFLQAVPKVMEHYQCGWKTAEDIVVRVLNWLPDTAGEYVPVKSHPDTERLNKLQHKMNLADVRIWDELGLPRKNTLVEAIDEAEE